LMKISHVIRGEDHLSNTPKHILMLQAMGFEPPQYGHLSLIHGPGGEPLSKRLESVSVREFRKHGYLPQALANYIALLGWSPGDNREVLSWNELMKDFDLAHVNKSASAYDPVKLDWVNGQHLRTLSDQDFTKQALSYLKKQKKLKYDEKLVCQVLPVFKDNITRFEELEERLQILDENFPYEDQAVITQPESHELLKVALEVLLGLKGSGETLYEEFVGAVKPKVKLKGKHLFMPIRMALTGKQHGPELKRIFPVFGIESIRRRFQRAIQIQS